MPGRHTPRGRTPRGVVPEQPGPNQESVWDYPRPPALEPVVTEIEVHLGGVRICGTHHALRVLETSHPPTYYLPRADFVPGSLVPADGSSFCEWKGLAAYLTLVGGDRTEVAAAWYYPEPTAGFAALVDHVALYPGRVDLVTVDGEPVTAQPGGFYGGWITSRVVGPFKGVAGSWGW